MVQVFRLCAKIHKGMTPPEVMGYLIKHEKEVCPWNGEMSLAQARDYGSQSRASIVFCVHNL